MYLMITNHHETTPTGVKADSIEQLDSMYNTMKAVFDSSKFTIQESDYQFTVSLPAVSKVALVTVRKVYK